MDLHVLVVDDNGFFVQMIRGMLERHGIEVSSVGSGLEALTAVERRRPDVVLLDVQMPGMNGFEVLERIKANPHLTKIPVIMLTARGEADDLISGYRSGADYYLTKPVALSELVYGLSLVLGREIRPVDGAAPAAPAPAQRKPSDRTR